MITNHEIGFEHLWYEHYCKTHSMVFFWCASFFKSKTLGLFGDVWRLHHQFAKCVKAQQFNAMPAIVGLLMSSSDTHWTIFPPLFLRRSLTCRSDSHNSAKSPTGRVCLLAFRVSWPFPALARLEATVAMIGSVGQRQQQSDDAVLNPRKWLQASIGTSGQISTPIHGI